MGKQPTEPDNEKPDTSYNIYSPPETDLSDKNIRESLIEFLKKHGENGVIMSSLIFTSSEVSEMLDKAVVTINKEARELDIGILKGISRFYTQEDIIKLHDSFAAKRKPKSKEKSIYRETISWTLFQEVRRLREEHERLIFLVGSVFDSITKRLETLEGK